MSVRLLTVIVATVVLFASGCGSETAVIDSSVTLGASVAPSAEATVPEPSTSSSTTTSTTASPPTSTSSSTTTLPPPPDLTVTDPLPGAVVDTRAYRFRGTVEPGASLVAAGRYDVPVDPDGTWSIVLMLEPGGNLARFVATGEGGPACVDVSVRYEPPIVLRGDGLGVVDLGRTTGEALDVLEATLGPPSRSDEGFFRYWYWDGLGLTVAFDEYPFYRDDGAEHFVSWSLWGDPLVRLRTWAGIGLGDDLESLVAGHGSRVSEPMTNDECGPPWYVWLDEPGSDMRERVLVAFDGEPLQGGVISYLHAGAGEGC